MMWLDRLVAIATILFIGLKFTDAHLAVMSVDLGSEYIKIALVKPGVPMEIITNEDSARKTAAIVCLRNGERLFGNPAENCATKFPSNAFWYLTQIVGKKYDDPAVAQYQRRFPYYKLVKDEDRGTILFQIDEETQYTPEELLAMILEKAKQYAETFADQTIKDTVITVPAFFNQAERRAVLLAAELGGLNVLQLMGDNAAVALNYGVFRRKQFNSSMTYIMFYDMGATSTTATIVGYQVVKMKEGTRMVENPQLVVKGVGFDRELGGLEISMRLRDHLAKYFSEHKKTKTDLYTNYRAMAKLLKEAKRVKKVLSANVEHMAQVEGLLDDEDFKMKVTRQELEEMCADMFNRVTTPIEDALKASEITLAEISDVILMGGGSRIPAVQAKLMEYLGRVELGKSLNTDEAAALGAVYQAAYLGKGFKVLTFGVKEANMYPIVVEFEKQRAEDSTDPPKIIKRTLFGRMNPYPQKKVMTFNKHFKDFSFNVTYGELDFLPENEAKVFRELQGQIHEIALYGVEEAYSKHPDAKEAKGIKAHFKMDESGTLTLDLVETVFEKEEKVVEEESTWSKLGGKLTGLFGKTEDVKEADNADLPPEGSDKAESQTGDEPKTGDDTAQGDKTDQSETDQSKTDTEGKKEEEVPAEEEKQEKTEEGKKEETEQQEKKTENGEKKDEKKDDKKEEGEKKPKIIIVKENITTETSITDTKPPSKESLKASKKKLADLTAKDKEKKLLEKAKNELESFVYDTMDKLSQEMYERCSTEEEREKYNKMLSEASDWLYEQEEDTPKEPFVEKLKSLKKEVKELGKRVKEFKERPEALATLDGMLNHSSLFLLSIKNLSAIEIEDKVFTDVEIETLEKLINETEEWKATMIKEQSAIPDYEKPKLLIEDIAFKMQALDREVKYLINKAKTFKPKPKAKPAKNKTETNGTKADTSDKKADSDTKEDVKVETDDTSTPPDTEIPAPPTGDDTEQPAAEDTEAEETTPKPTEEPKAKNTHNPEDL
ncbi:hypoxia up-regulated protein 1-like isoform X2 [Mercenaria mercenaria]|uniref:hypoxia up-regulated protein 1-like isoform X2 n=1 Tax=Mercenaria mercenaria TaxID=6596 RepID=UPI00234F99E2|nr:hypoxia up-regulated protein 1-like isoform X2 [Mercenaria mercenaria]